MPVLPKVPVPHLSDTLRRYLQTMRPIVSINEYHRQKQLVDAFERVDGPGRRLQRRLEQIADVTDNWVNDFWLNDMYLSVRLPLPINSSPAMVFPRQQFSCHSIVDWLRFAASIIGAAIDFKTMIQHDLIQTETVAYPTFGQPLCMQQYDQLFGTIRHPGDACDQLLFGGQLPSCGDEPEVNKIVVLCRSQMFVVEVTMTSDGRRRKTTDNDILRQLISCEQQTTENGENDERDCNEETDVDIVCTTSNDSNDVGLMTSADRTTWSSLRRQLNEDSMHRRNFTILDSSAFILCLDAEKTHHTSSQSRRLADSHTDDYIAMAHRLLHGSGTAAFSGNRFFDKTLQFIVGQDGTCGLCYEHSPADGLVVVKLAEYVLRYANENYRRLSVSSLSTGTRESMTASSPVRLLWNLPSDVQWKMKSVARDVDRAINNLELDILHFYTFGREFPKSHQISPDVFIQLALQLTYFRLHRRLVTTYESASLRRFRFGRVDNIRSCTTQALDWCAAMTKNLIGYDGLAITGQGIDNHLLALRQLALETEEDMPKLFTDDVYEMANRFLLSTSQVQTSTDTFMLYGPVTADGYGVSYNPKANSIVFCISSFKSSPDTDSRQFAAALSCSLVEMAELCAAMNRANVQTHSSCLSE